MILCRMFCTSVLQTQHLQIGLLFDSSVMLKFLLSLASLNRDDITDFIQAYTNDRAHTESECHVLDFERFV